MPSTAAAQVQAYSKNMQRVRLPNKAAHAPETGRSQMRVVLLAACLATLVIAGWSNYSTVADAKLRGDFTINPTAMMATTGQLPVEQYEAF